MRYVGNEGIANNISESGFEVVESKTIEDAIYIACSNGLATRGVAKILQDQQTTVVLVFGPENSGKTSLIAGIYELFQKGVVSPYRFSGSKTLLAFEQRCHDARTNSKRPLPTTARTSQTSRDFLHLEIDCVDDQASRKRSLLMLDLAGAKVEAFSNREAELSEISFWDRVDHFAFIIDCEAITDKNNRYKVKTKLLNLLRRLLEAEKIPLSAKIQLIFAKWDFVKTDDFETLELKESFEKEVRDSYLVNGHQALSQVVASLPIMNDDLEAGHGLNSLLEVWIENSAFFNKPTCSGNKKHKGKGRVYENY